MESTPQQGSPGALPTFPLAPNPRNLKEFPLHLSARKLHSHGLSQTITVSEPDMSAKPLLIVDDNPSNLKLLRVLLTGEGFEVRTANNAEEALASLLTFHPELILTDIQMPGMDGLELARRLKSNPSTKAIPVVAITAYAMSGDEAKARQAGCDAYVAKPIDTRTLPGLLNGLLTQH